MTLFIRVEENHYFEKVVNINKGELISNPPSFDLQTKRKTDFRPRLAHKGKLISNLAWHKKENRFQTSCPSLGTKRKTNFKPLLFA